MNKRRRQTTIAATSRGGIGLELGGGGGGGTTEGIIDIKNHSGSTYIGWVTGTMPPLRADSFGAWLTDGTRTIGFGRNVGEDRRMVHVLIPSPGIAPAGTLTIDLSTCTPTSAPAMGTLADVPSVGGTALTLQTTTDDGAARIYRYQGKLNTWFTATIWIYYRHGHNVHPLEFLVTNSNCSDPDIDHKSNPNLAVTIGAGTVTWTGTIPATGTLTFGPDSAQAFCGALRYGGAAADIASASCLTDHPVELWCPEHATTWPPIGKSAYVGTAFNANTFRTANLATLKANVGTLNYSGLGPHPNSGRVADQESEGWISCAEPFDPDHPNAGCIWVNHLGTIEMFRRNINYRESDGNLISPITRNRAYCWVGNPWWGDNSTVPGGIDFLGKAYPGKDGDESNIVTAGPGTGERWYGPEGQHHFMQRYGEGYLLTGSLLVQELLLTWGINYILQEHTNPLAPNTRNANSNTPCSMGWSSLTAVWLYISIDDRNFADDIKNAWLARMEQVFLTRTLNEISTYGKVGPQIFSPIATLSLEAGAGPHTTTKTVCATLLFDQQYEGATISMTSGNNAGLSRIVTSNNTTDINHAAFPVANSPGDDFSLGGLSPTTYGWESHYGHLSPGVFDPLGVAIDRYPGRFIYGVSPDQAVILIWQHSLAVGGIYCAWVYLGQPQSVLNLLLILAEPLVEHGWFLDGGTWRATNTIGINLQNQVTGNRYSDNTFPEWNVWGVAAFLRVAAPSHRLYSQALAIWNQQYAGYINDNAVLKWIMPID